MMSTTTLTHQIIRLPGMSLRLHRRSLVAGIAMAGIIAAVALWALMAGDFVLSPARVLATLFGQGQGSENFVILNLRLPRVLTGIFAGMAFGVAGALLQSLARNPLASPDIIGFDSGAALGAVTTVVVLGATGFGVAVGAMVGGVAAALVVLGASWDRGLAPIRLVLVGIGIGLCLYAAVQFLLSRSDIFEAAAAQAWITGSLNARVSWHVLTSGIGVALLVPAALMLHAALERLEMGDDLATALGTRVNLVRLATGGVAVLLASVAVATAGPLPFVALAAAPLARRIAGASGPTLLLAGLVGAIIVTGADLAGRLLFAPIQLPAGIFTAVLGAPYLLWLLATQIRKGSM
jgi:iron complex transport system permease protein